MRNLILCFAIAFIIIAPSTFASAQSMQGYIKTQGAKQGQSKGEARPPQSAGGGSTGPTAPPKPTQGDTHK